LNTLVEIFPSPYELAERYAGKLIGMIADSAGKKKSFTIALPGGSTPGLLFSILGDHFSKSVPWENVHFFWGDERCVQPGDPESNFGVTREKLLGKIDIPEENIHRIRGEEDPEMESERYSKEIIKFTAERNGLPMFDLILLGLGEDGHTASIFPENIWLFNSAKVSEVSVHPHTKQKRITITGNVINNAENVTFLVTGKRKAAIIREIIEKRDSATDYPAAHVIPAFGELHWILDMEAGIFLK